MRVIDLPASLDFQTSDALFAEISEAGGEKVLFDGRHLRWVGPNGMVGLLAAGSVARDRSGEAPVLELGTAGDKFGGILNPSNRATPIAMSE